MYANMKSAPKADLHAESLMTANLNESTRDGSKNYTHVFFRLARSPPSINPRLGFLRSAIIKGELTSLLAGILLRGR